MTRDELIETMARAMAAGDSAEIGTVLFDEIHWPEFGPGYTESAKNALTAIEAAGLAIVPVDATVSDPHDYDAGLLNDFGGGNVEWWQDYIRAEIARANDFWRSQTGPAMIEAGRI